MFSAVYSTDMILVWCDSMMISDVQKNRTQSSQRSLLRPSPSPESTKISQAKTMVKKAGKYRKDNEICQREFGFFGKPLLESDREEWICLPLSSDTLKLLYKTSLDPCEKHDEKRSDTSISRFHEIMTHTHSFFPFLSFADSTSKSDRRVHLHNTRACVFTFSVACSCSCLCYRCWWCSWR